MAREEVIARNMARRVEDRGMVAASARGGEGEIPLVTAVDDAGVAGGGGDEVVLAAARTSSFMIRPFLPVPLTIARSTPFSRAIRRVAGVTNISLPSAGEGEAIGAEEGGSGVGDEEDGAGGAGDSSNSTAVDAVAGSTDSSASSATTSTSQRVLPTLSMSPAFPANLWIVPEKGEVISTEALSDLWRR